MRHPLAANAAKESTKAIIYQLCVAIEKCWEMKAGEKIYIEELGDVTNPGQAQTEVKVYSNPLTDNHENFWKTLKNWVTDNFTPSHYTSLILYTTQKFGEEATLSTFNDSAPAARLSLIKSIHEKSEKRIQESSNANGTITVPNVLSLQRYVFDNSREQKLNEVVAKMQIAADAPNLAQLCANIQQIRMKGILEGKKADFLNSLIGFVSKPAANVNEDWEITYEDFCTKVGELYGTFGRETRLFPRASFTNSSPLDKDKLAQYRGYNFVQKIKEIEYDPVIPEAVKDYLQTMETIHQEFKTYSVPSDRTTNYTAEEVRRFNSKHRQASRKCSNLINDSQGFYDEITGDEPLQFEGFDNRPIAGFRNGILHMKMDEDDSLAWRLNLNE